MSDFTEAQQYEREKKFVKAVQFYQNVIDSFFIFAFPFERSDSEAAIFRILNSNIITGVDLNNIAVLYHKGEEVKKNYTQAKLLFEKACKKNCAIAYSNLGVMYENAQDIPKDLVVGAKYYQQAIDKGYFEAKVKLNKLLSLTEITGTDLINIGILYHKGEEVKKNHAQAKLLYEKACAKNSAIAHYNLGIIYEYSSDIPKDLVIAAKCYQQAIDKGYLEAKVTLETLLNSTKITGKELNSIGLIYNKADGIIQNREQEKICYEKACAKNSAVAHYNLGIMYKNTQGVKKNLVMTAKYYQQAIDKGYLEAKIKLDELLNSIEITGVDLNNIGVLYHAGKNIKQNYTQAKSLFEKACEKNSVTAYFNLGIIYENAQDVPKDIVTAIQYYQIAADKGYGDAHKKIAALYHNNHYGQGKADRLLKASEHYIKALEKRDSALKTNDDILVIQKLHDELINLPDFPQNEKKRSGKLFEKTFITVSASREDFPNILDNQGKTLLHRSAEKQYFKHCARLIFLGADKTIRAKDNHQPFSSKYLNDTQKNKITKLQNGISILRTNLKAPSEEILATHVLVFRDGSRPLEENLSTLRQLCTIEEVKPLMDLAKLAALGLHDLSNRDKLQKIESNEYDSDDDDNESINMQEQMLWIHFDPEKPNISDMYHYGPSGLEGKTAYGICPYTTNTIYIAGQRESREKIRGTMIHELTHFLAQEVFKNACKPYCLNDNINKNRFIDITNILRNKRNSLDPKLEIFKTVFNPMCYTQENWHCELIVRIPQIIVEHGSSGRAKLRQQAPELLQYYNEVFLKAIKNHTKKLEERALSNWDEEIFGQNEQTSVFRFDTALR